MTKLLLAAILVVPAVSLNAEGAGKSGLFHNGFELQLDAAPKIQAQGVVSAAPNPFAQALVTLYTRIHKIEGKVQYLELEIVELDVKEEDSRLSREEELERKTLQAKKAIYQRYENSARQDLQELLGILKNLPAFG